MRDTFQLPDSVTQVGGMAAIINSLNLQLMQLLIAIAAMLGLSIYEVVSHFPFDSHVLLDLAHQRSKLGPQTICYFLARYLSFVRMALELDAVFKLATGDFAHSLLMPAKQWTLTVLAALIMTSSSMVLLLRIPALLSRPKWSIALVLFLGAGQVICSLLWGSFDSSQFSSGGSTASSAANPASQPWAVSSELTVRYWCALGIDVSASAFVIASLRSRAQGFLRYGIEALLFKDALFFLLASIVVNTSAGVITLHYPSNVLAILGSVDVTACLVSILACHIFRAQYRFLHSGGTIIMSDSVSGDLDAYKYKWAESRWRSQQHTPTLELAQTRSEQQTSLKNMTSRSRMLSHDPSNVDDSQTACGVRSYTGESMARRQAYSRRDSDAQIRMDADVPAVLTTPQTIRLDGKRRRSDHNSFPPRSPSAPYTPELSQGYPSPVESNLHFPLFSPPLSPVASPPSALHRRSNSNTKRGWKCVDRAASQRNIREKAQPYSSPTARSGSRGHKGSKALDDSPQSISHTLATTSPLFAPIRLGNRELPALAKADITPFLAEQPRSRQAQLAGTRSNSTPSSLSHPSTQSWKLRTQSGVSPIDEARVRPTSTVASSSRSEDGDHAASPTYARNASRSGILSRASHRRNSNSLRLRGVEDSDEDGENSAVSHRADASGRGRNDLSDPHTEAYPQISISGSPFIGDTQLNRRLSSPFGWKHCGSDGFPPAATLSTLSHEMAGVKASDIISPSLPPPSSTQKFRLRDVHEHPLRAQPEISAIAQSAVEGVRSVPCEEILKWTRKELERRGSVGAHDGPQAGSVAYEGSADFETLWDVVQPLHRPGSVVSERDGPTMDVTCLADAQVGTDNAIADLRRKGSELSIASVSDFASAFGVTRSSPRLGTPGSKRSSNPEGDTDENMYASGPGAFRRAVDHGEFVGAGEAGGIEAPRSLASRTSPFGSDHSHLPSPHTRSIASTILSATYALDQSPHSGRPPPPRRRTRSTVTSPSPAGRATPGSPASGPATTAHGGSLPETSELGLPIREDGQTAVQNTQQHKIGSI